MTKIYETQEWKGYGKQNYYWNEYWRDGDKIIKLKCHRFKFFDGDESSWEEEKNGIYLSYHYPICAEFSL